MSSLSNIQNSVVLVRVGYDLPNLQDVARIKDSLPTLNRLLENNNKLVLLTKWGRPDGESQDLSTQNLVTVIENEIKEKVAFLNQYTSFENTKNQIQNTNSKIFLLENLYFNSDEQSKDSNKRLDLAKKYASLGQYFVDECFISSHRKDATNTEIKTLLPTFLGLGYSQEIQHLDKLKIDPKRPFVAVMAGAKLETKLELITQMITKVDKILLGGLLCFTFIQAKKELGEINLPELKKSSIELNFLETAKELLQKYPGKILTPVDLVYKDDFAKDVGPKTLEYYKENLADSQTLFWNGTLGHYEEMPFDYGTIELAKYMTSLQNCFKVIGGGDTNASLPAEILAGFDFVSMGGGATLDYLSK